jgi:hypothetical protein
MIRSQSTDATRQHTTPQRRLTLIQLGDALVRLGLLR